MKSRLTLLEDPQQTTSRAKTSILDAEKRCVKSDVLYVYILSHGFLQLYISFHIKMSKNTQSCKISKDRNLPRMSWITPIWMLGFSSNHCTLCFIWYPAMFFSKMFVTLLLVNVFNLKSEKLKNICFLNVCCVMML